MYRRSYGETFTLPRAVHPDTAARVMDLADPASKMDKTAVGDAGVLFVLDPPDVVRRKVARAVTDSLGVVRHDREQQPGVTNLLDIFAACTGETPEFSTYGALKSAVTDAVIAELAPIRERYAELSRDPATVEKALAHGLERAHDRAAATVARARTALGLA